MRFYLTALLLGPGGFLTAQPPAFTGNWQLKESEVSYTVNHPFKTATGISRASKGKGRCSAMQCEVLIAVAVGSFDSGDSNRDLHMLEATKGAAFPVVTVRAQFKPTAGTSRVDFEIEFAGVKAVAQGVELVLNQQGKMLQAEGKFTLRLSDFSIVRPSLLGLAIDNDVPITIRSVWEAAK